jgi:hypothetical protein
MAELNTPNELNVLPHDEVHFELPDDHLLLPPPPVLLHGLETKSYSVPVPARMPAPVPTPTQEEIKLPLRIHIRKQKLPVPLYEPEQEFYTSSLDINPDELDKLDAFLNTNLPKDSVFKADAIKFVENVLLGKTEEKNKWFNKERSHPSLQAFLISFS